MRELVSSSMFIFHTCSCCGKTITTFHPTMYTKSFSNHHTNKSAPEYLYVCDDCSQKLINHRAVITNSLFR